MVAAPGPPPPSPPRDGEAAPEGGARGWLRVLALLLVAGSLLASESRALASLASFTPLSARLAVPLVLLALALLADAVVGWALLALAGTALLALLSIDRLALGSLSVLPDLDLLAEPGALLSAGDRPPWPDAVDLLLLSLLLLGCGLCAAAGRVHLPAPARRRARRDARLGGLLLLAVAVPLGRPVLLPGPVAPAYSTEAARESAHPGGLLVFHARDALQQAHERLAADEAPPLDEDGARALLAARAARAAAPAPLHAVAAGRSVLLVHLTGVTSELLGWGGGAALPHLGRRLPGALRFDAWDSSGAPRDRSLPLLAGRPSPAVEPAYLLPLGLPAALSRAGYRGASLLARGEPRLRPLHHALLGLERGWPPVAQPEDAASWAAAMAGRLFALPHPFVAHVATPAVHKSAARAESAALAAELGLPADGALLAALAAAREADRALDELLARLAEARVLERFVVVAYGGGDPPLDRDATASLRHASGQPAGDEVVRLPVVVLVPGREGPLRAAAAEVGDTFCQLADVAPTLLRLLGLDVPATMTGAPLVLPPFARGSFAIGAWGAVVDGELLVGEQLALFPSGDERDRLLGRLHDAREQAALLQAVEEAGLLADLAADAVERGAPPRGGPEAGEPWRRTAIGRRLLLPGWARWVELLGAAGARVELIARNDDSVPAALVWAGFDAEGTRLFSAEAELAAGEETPLLPPEAALVRATHAFVEAPPDVRLTARVAMPGGVLPRPVVAAVSERTVLRGDATDLAAVMLQIGNVTGEPVQVEIIARDEDGAFLRAELTVPAFGLASRIVRPVQRRGPLWLEVRGAPVTVTALGWNEDRTLAR